MKEKKSVTLPEWLINEMKRQHPNMKFSNIVEGMCLSCVNNPVLFWRSKAKYDHQKVQSALLHMNTLKEMKVKPVVIDTLR